MAVEIDKGAVGGNKQAKIEGGRLSYLETIIIDQLMFPVVDFLYLYFCL